MEATHQLPDAERLATPPPSVRQRVAPASKQASAASHVALVESLRGLAAVGVMWFHFTQGNGAFLTDGWLKSSGRFGYLGVDAFFVISGFVVPYSLAAGGYSLSVRNYLRFLAKRLCRIDPPYLVSVAVVVALNVLSAHTPGFRGAAPSHSWQQIGLHVGYAAEIVGTPWINVVYWSLAIEFQFYVLLGLLLPGLVSSRLAVRASVLAALCVSPFLAPSSHFVPHYLYLFLGGFALLAHRLGRHPLEVATMVCLSGGGTLATIGPGAAVAVIGTTLATLVAPNAHIPVTSLLGQLSYSLYLMHVPIGGRVINIGARLQGTLLMKAAILALAALSSLAVSYALYRYVEMPCRRLASRVRFLRLTSPASVFTSTPSDGSRAPYAAPVL